MLMRCKDSPDPRFGMVADCFEVSWMFIFVT